MNYTEFLEQVNNIITVKYTDSEIFTDNFDDFIIEDNSLQFQDCHVECKLSKKLEINGDFTSLYNNIMTQLYECSLENIVDDDFMEKINSPILETDDTIKTRKFVSRILNASNYIAIKSRIGAGQIVLYNYNNTDSIKSILDKNLCTDYKFIVSDAVPVNTLCVCRKAMDDKTGVFLLLYKNESGIFYDIIKVGKNYDKQYINFKF